VRAHVALVPECAYVWHCVHMQADCLHMQAFVTEHVHVGLSIRTRSIEFENKKLNLQFCSHRVAKEKK